MLASVNERCSKGKLKVFGVFQAVLAAIPGDRLRQDGPHQRTGNLSGSSIGS